MKLNIVPAYHGIVWIGRGLRTFARQPLALTGLFFMFMAVISVVSLVPVLGPVLALVLLPAGTAGLIAAAREAAQGRFPMPAVLASALLGGPQRRRAMLLLGALYAVGFLVVMGLSTLLDGGQFAQLYVLGGKITDEMVRSSDFQAAMWLAMGLYLPLSLTFWHAPALVHWQGIAPAKALFYSAVACWRNLGAMTVYGLGWMVLFALSGVVIVAVTALLGSTGLLSMLLMPYAVLMAAVFFSSIYFSFLDSFVFDPPADTPSSA